MSWTDYLHASCIHPRRVRVLSEHFARIIPQSTSVLDVGCGDGRLACLIAHKRPDLSFQGIDVLLRPDNAITASVFDGKTIPFDNQSFDVVMFADVLHHTVDPAVLLKEATRVARRAIAIKDHLLRGVFAGTTLAFMDRAGNKRHGVALPYNYWAEDKWNGAFKALKIEVELWEQRLKLYPFPVNLLFDRSLHFLARLAVTH
jgi:SAM-dependent methyltransferase